ncbi:MAG TPA: hypothetical protein DDY12_04175 [Porphyromonadaceae bacterium]|nr:hypothetical protein [Porphyromonadaceae bacterium]
MSNIDNAKVYLMYKIYFSKFIIIWKIWRKAMWSLNQVYLGLKMVITGRNDNFGSENETNA